MNAIETFSQIQIHAESHKNRTEQHVEPVIGQAIAQGDINLLALPAIPSQAKPSKPNSQLAPGTSRGSRHCIAASDMHKVEFFAFPDPNPLEGGVLRFSGQVRIEHPEHGDLIYPAGTILAIGYQRRYAETLKRIQD